MGLFPRRREALFLVALSEIGVFPGGPRGVVPAGHGEGRVLLHEAGPVDLDAAGPVPARHHRRHGDAPDGRAATPDRAHAPGDPGQLRPRPRGHLRVVRGEALLERHRGAGPPRRAPQRKDRRHGAGGRQGPPPQRHRGILRGPGPHLPLRRHLPAHHLRAAVLAGRAGPDHPAAARFPLGGLQPVGLCPQLPRRAQLGPDPLPPRHQIPRLRLCARRIVGRGRHHRDHVLGDPLVRRLVGQRAQPDPGRPLLRRRAREEEAARPPAVRHQRQDVFARQYGPLGHARRQPHLLARPRAGDGDRRGPRGHAGPGRVQRLRRLHARAVRRERGHHHRKAARVQRLELAGRRGRVPRVGAAPGGPVEGLGHVDGAGRDRRAETLDAAGRGGGVRGRVVARPGRPRGEPSDQPAKVPDEAPRRRGREHHDHLDRRGADPAAGSGFRRRVFGAALLCQVQGMGKRQGGVGRDQEEQTGGEEGGGGERRGGERRSQSGLSSILKAAGNCLGLRHEEQETDLVGLELIRLAMEMIISESLGDIEDTSYSHYLLKAPTTSQPRCWDPRQRR